MAGGKSLTSLGVQLALIVVVYTVTKSSAQGCFCTFQYDPVCGSDGQTYGNSCQLQCETERNSNLRLVSRGACGSANAGGRPVLPNLGRPSRQPQRQGCFCLANYQPVCGSDGQTYSNSCQLGCQAGSGVSVSYQGACRGGSRPRPRF